MSEQEHTKYMIFVLTMLHQSVTWHLARALEFTLACPGSDHFGKMHWLLHFEIHIRYCNADHF